MHQGWARDPEARDPEAREREGAAAPPLDGAREPLLFFYGTLRDPELLRRVAGRDPVRLSPARARGWRVVFAPGEDYPILVPSARGADLAEDVAVGVVAEGLGADARARILEYEDDGYALRDLDVTLDADGRTVRASAFLPGGEYMARLSEGPGRPWTLDDWSAEARAATLAALDVLGPWFERIGPTAAMRLWTDFLGRHDVARKPRLTAGMTRADMRIERRETLQDGFLRLERIVAAHRRFDGGEGPTIEREVVRKGPAVMVLPYDPDADLVLLIELWRAAPAAAGDPNPWFLEAPAGRQDIGETPEATARRECLEEAGVPLGRLERIAEIYSSPASFDETITAFIGEARLDHLAETIGGLAAEAEDIRRLIVPLETALIAAARGEIRNAHALLSLYWLDRHRERLIAEWRDRRPGQPKHAEGAGS